MRALETKLPPVALTLILAVVAWSLAYVTPQVTFHIPFQTIIVVLLLIAGAAISIAGVYSFRVGNTTVNPTTPSESSSVVTTGVYGYSRNPMYVGFGLALLAVVVHLGNLTCCLVIPFYVAYMNRFQIKPEEQALLGKFGAPFAAYMDRVRRWI
jgi:protein-S-isoprenylcysteine O-methyltransferase Ste14